MSLDTIARLAELAVSGLEEPANLFLPRKASDKLIEMEGSFRRREDVPVAAQ